jgi:hypothetical protein
MAEKFAFGPAADNDGLLYPQSMISERKLAKMLAMARMGPPECIKGIEEGFIFGPPDETRLDGILDKVWESSAANFQLRETLTRDRPTCVLCEKVVTKRDHDRQFFSRYCKDHYHQARQLYDESARAAFTVCVVSIKP